MNGLNIFHPSISNNILSLEYNAHDTGSSSAMTDNGSTFVSPLSHNICKL